MTLLDELYATPTLPDRRGTEVEIARINIDSTTSDVTSVYARPGKDRIYYRVVDEYWGDTLSWKRTRSSKRQLRRLLLRDEVKQQQKPEGAKRKAQIVELRHRTSDGIG